MSVRLDDERVASLYLSGASQKEIADELGCSQTGVLKSLRRSGVQSRSLSEAARIGAAKRERVGRYVESQGYVAVLVPPDDPMASMRMHNGYVKEHRLVMARHIGRPLLPSETVHHINGDRADNRIENLQLRQGQHGSGVVLECYDCGSQNIHTKEIPYK